ncbi:MAG TPA: 3',5'-cyclic-nucleotide phosphodiesterase, partial [Thermoanaerobaculia bacterium]
MDIKILGCFGGALPGHFTTNFVVNQTVAIDAGALAFGLSFEEQCKIRHVFITHSHLDHTASLPFVVDNVFGFIDSPIHVRSIEPVIWSLRTHLFNNHTWPDFSVIPDPETSILKFHAIEPLIPVCVDGLKLTPIPVNHTVPCVG